MIRFILFFTLITTCCFSFSQEIVLVKATKQTINSGASPTSTTNYLIEVKKSKKCKIAIDSVVNVYTLKTVNFNIVKVDNPLAVSPNYQKVNVLNIKEKGLFHITFASMKNRGSGGRPGAPMNLMVPVADFTQGAIVYYRVGKKTKQLVVESFDQLETINAP